MSPEEVVAKWRQQTNEPEGYESPEGLLVRLTIRLCADELESLVRASAPSVAEPAKAFKEAFGHTEHCNKWVDDGDGCWRLSGTRTCSCAPPAVEAKEPQ